MAMAHWPMCLYTGPYGCMVLSLQGIQSQKQVKFTTNNTVLQVRRMSTPTKEESSSSGTEPGGRAPTETKMESSRKRARTSANARGGEQGKKTRGIQSNCNYWTEREKKKVN